MRKHLLLYALCLATVPPALALDAGVSDLEALTTTSTTMSDVSHNEPRAKSFFGKNNETPQDVQEEVSELQESMVMAAELEPKRIPDLKKKLSLARTRLSIALLRVERDRLKKADKKDEAQQVDAKIHELKQRLEAAAPAKSTWRDLLKIADHSEE